MSPSQINTILSKLAKHRPVFHSEADFQHALAWEFQKFDPKARIRLEKQLAVDGPRVHLDLLVVGSNYELAIELKYKTRKADIEFLDERFLLRNHGAQDCGRYEFIKDIYRLGNFVLARSSAVGYALLLTNDQSYWSSPRRDGTFGSAFRLFDGRSLEDQLAWEENTGAGTTRGREAPIPLRGNYTLSWAPFSSITSQHFRYLLIQVENGNRNRIATKSGGGAKHYSPLRT